MLRRNGNLGFDEDQVSLGPTYVKTIQKVLTKEPLENLYSKIILEDLLATFQC